MNHVVADAQFRPSFAELTVCGRSRLDGDRCSPGGSALWLNARSHVIGLAAHCRC